jgi:hypothetical protein
MESKNVISYTRLYGLTLANVTTEDLIGIDNLETVRMINIYEKIDDLSNLREAIKTSNETLFRETVNAVLSVCYLSDLIRYGRKFHIKDDVYLYTCIDRSMYLIGNDHGDIWSVRTTLPEQYQEVINKIIHPDN